MKKYTKRGALLILALSLIIAAGTKSSPDCNGCGVSHVYLPLSFFGSILGCSSEQPEKTTDTVKELTCPYNYENKINAGSESVTLVKLGSSECMPCRMMVSVLDEVEKKYGDMVDIITYDIRTPEGEPYAKKFQIRGIPTQVFLDEDGKEFFRHTGFFPLESIEKVLKSKGIE